MSNGLFPCHRERTEHSFRSQKSARSVDACIALGKARDYKLLLRDFGLLIRPKPLAVSCSLPMFSSGNHARVFELSGDPVSWSSVQPLHKHNNHHLEILELDETHRARSLDSLWALEATASWFPRGSLDFPSPNTAHGLPPSGLQHCRDLWERLRGCEGQFAAIRGGRRGL